MKIEDFEDIVYTKEENGICTATISRPERRNADYFPLWKPQRATEFKFKYYDFVVRFKALRNSSSAFIKRGDVKDIIFNLAGTLSHIDSMTDPVTDLEINCRAQLSLLESIRKFNPKARANFLARHNCDKKNNKLTAGYWSCQKWL